MRELFLTFDVEDFISENSTQALKFMIEKLDAYGLRGLFFITGHMAEKLRAHPEIVKLLGNHQIGYHSSSHSVIPSIFHFTDVTSYQAAIENSRQREISHIDPLTGEIKGPGGIEALRELFPTKTVTAFRAPGYCWHPAHLEALKELGIRYDFSADVSSRPVVFKGFVFYPYPVLPSNWLGTRYHYRLLLRKMLVHKTTVLTFHPSDYVNETFWDSIYREANPDALAAPKPLDAQRSAAMLNGFDLLLKRVKLLSGVGALKVTPPLCQNQKQLRPTKGVAERCYQRSIEWAIYRNYKPQHMESHFYRFFSLNHVSCLSNGLSEFS
ncbi:MAG: hypothetical protein ACM3UY_00110 [Methanocella sp.]|jgi:peptidoglycan/xylan/chitin deacetylase (PgdA/CDA1 family)